MAVDVKNLMADAVMKLLFEENRKKITVKDIVEECNITRQAFYYHFADIPELLGWMIDQKADEVMAELRQQKNPKDAIRYWILMSVNARQGFQKSMESNYGKELEKLITDKVESLFFDIATLCMEAQGIDMPEYDRKLLVRLHTYGFMGIMRSWTDEDSENIDHIVDLIYDELSECE